MGRQVDRHKNKSGTSTAKWHSSKRPERQWTVVQSRLVGSDVQMAIKVMVDNSIAMQMMMLHVVAKW